MDHGKDEHELDEVIDVAVTCDGTWSGYGVWQSSRGRLGKY